MQLVHALDPLGYIPIVCIDVFVKIYKSWNNKYHYGLYSLVYIHNIYLNCKMSIYDSII